MDAKNEKLYKVEETIIDLTEEFGGEVGLILSCAGTLIYKARMVLFRDLHKERNSQETEEKKHG